VQLLHRLVLPTASATQFETLRYRTQRNLKEVHSVDYAVPAFFERGLRFICKATIA